MRLRIDTIAASPLVVIATFVLVAVVLTAGAYALFFDRPDPSVRLVQEQAADGALSFNVTQTRGGLDWESLTVRFLDRAGTDQAAIFLHVPAGSVGRGDVIAVEPQPAAGTYVLLVTHKGGELARLTVLV